MILQEKRLIIIAVHRATNLNLLSMVLIFSSSILQDNSSSILMFIMLQQKSLLLLKFPLLIFKVTVPLFSADSQPIFLWTEGCQQFGLLYYLTWFCNRWLIRKKIQMCKGQLQFFNVNYHPHPLQKRERSKMGCLKIMKVPLGGN